MPFLAELAERTLPWEAVHVFQVDERVAPPGHADRNLTGLQAALLDRVPIPPGNVHPMPVEEPDLDAAAAAYADEIRAVAGPDGSSTSSTSASATTATPPRGRPATRWSTPPTTSPWSARSTAGSA